MASQESSEEILYKFKADIEKDPRILNSDPNIF